MGTSVKYVVACPECGVRLKVKARMLGHSARCPKCCRRISVPETGLDRDSTDLASINTTELQTADTTELRKLTRRAVTGRVPPATARQKEFARSLDCRFADDISAEEIADLIDAALLKNREQDQAQRDKFLTMQAKSYDLIRRELQEELIDDPQVSTASPRQMVDALGQRRMTSVLITLPVEDVRTLRDFEDTTPEITASRHVTDQDVGRIISLVAEQLRAGRLSSMAAS